MLYRWAEVMQGRVVIYDYDQGMLVWRDVPNPSIGAVRQDVKHYKKAGILGVSTESRNAIATTFLLDGTVDAVGVHPPETIIPPHAFLAALAPLCAGAPAPDELVLVT